MEIAAPCCLQSMRLHALKTSVRGKDLELRVEMRARFFPVDVANTNLAAVHLYCCHRPTRVHVHAGIQALILFAVKTICNDCDAQFSPAHLRSCLRSAPTSPSMKFGNLLRTSGEDIPELQNLFVCYKQLKKKLKRLPARPQPPGNKSLDQAMTTEERSFVQTLNADVLHFNDLFIEKEEESVIKLGSLEEQAATASTCEEISEVQRTACADVTCRLRPAEGRLSDTLYSVRSCQKRYRTCLWPGISADQFIPGSSCFC